MTPEQALNELVNAADAGDKAALDRITSALSPSERAAVMDIGYARLVDSCIAQIEEQA